MCLTVMSHQLFQVLGVRHRLETKPLDYLALTAALI
jgi:hypothetical protein